MSLPPSSVYEIELRVPPAQIRRSDQLVAEYGERAHHTVAAKPIFDRGLGCWIVRVHAEPPVVHFGPKARVLICRPAPREPRFRQPRYAVTITLIRGDGTDRLEELLDRFQSFARYRPYEVARKIGEWGVHVTMIAYGRDHAGALHAGACERSLGASYAPIDPVT